jgi:thiamine-monophosphate kinase
LAKTLRDVGEFGLIDRIAQLVPGSPQVIEGIGDDCAVVRVGDRVLLVSCDLCIEDVHFRRAYVSPEDIGWKAAARGLSDIAAMGGAPLFCLVALACPADTKVGFVEAMYRGMAQLTSQFGCVVVGGDTARVPDRIFIDVMVLGEVLGRRCLRRQGAQAGDLLAVTGHPGAAGAALYALEHDVNAPSPAGAYFRPVPRVPEGQWLCRRPAVHAMIDLSDGLFPDAGKLAGASGCGVNLESERLPIAPALARFCRKHGLDPVAGVLTWGEDYELAFALNPRQHERTLEAFGREFKTEITVVGSFSDQWHGVRVDGQELALTGFDHFKGKADG